MSDDDLIKRLRAAATHPMMDNNCKADVFDVAEAADRIESIRAALDAAEAALAKVDGAPTEIPPSPFGPIIVPISDETLERWRASGVDVDEILSRATKGDRP